MPRASELVLSSGSQTAGLFSAGQRNVTHSVTATEEWRKRSHGALTKRRTS